MPSLSGLAEAAAVAIEAAVPGLRTCEIYAGQFTEGEGRKKSFLAPAVFVSLAGGAVTDPGTAELDIEARMVAFAIWKADKGRNARGVGASELAAAIALAVRGNQWNVPGVRAARLGRVVNLYSAKLDAQGLALWSVEWSQVVRVGESIWAEDGIVPVEVFAGYVPDVGEGHEADYEEVLDAA
jgi:hypothetical protein